jgi:FixJ family two-component response regulator
MDQSALILVVEDDRDMRHSLVWMLRANGYRAEGFGTSEELLEVYDPDRPGCLLLDLELPNMSGLELIEHLRLRGCCHHPFIVISGHGEVAAAVTAMHSGAIDFLEKPFEHERLLDGVRQALERDSEARRRRLEAQSVGALVASLTQREREVMELVIAGKLTKQIAKDLGISPKTVEVHRSHLTRKMQVESVAQLVALMANYSAIQADPLVNFPPLSFDSDGRQSETPSSGS